MAVYKIGQIRGGGQESSTNYLNEISGEYDLVESKYNFGSDINDNGYDYSFQDLMWKRNDNTTFNSNQSYYLYFYINRVETSYYSNAASDNLNFQIVLASSTSTRTQVLVENLQVPSFSKNKGETPQIFYELLFTPELNVFDQIIFKMIRGTEDYITLGQGGALTQSAYSKIEDNGIITIEAKDTAYIEIDKDNSETISNAEKVQYSKIVLTVGGGSSEEGDPRTNKTCGRRWLIGDDFTPNPDGLDPDKLNIENLHCYQVTNLLKSSMVKIGVQTTPGTLIMVNNESIRVGRSGIYEVNNDITITSVGIAGSKGTVPQFLIDYAYYE